jgi:hypothetical protein
VQLDIGRTLDLLSRHGHLQDIWAERESGQRHERQVAADQALFVDGGSSLVKDKLPWAATLARVSSQRVPGGVAHKLPTDLRKALIANTAALDAWKDITPLARNEFICWVEDAKQKMTRERRIRRTQEELEEGQRRPCCWPGCRHRERTGR